MRVLYIVVNESRELASFYKGDPQGLAEAKEMFDIYKFEDDKDGGFIGTATARLYKEVTKANGTKVVTVIRSNDKEDYES